MSTETLLLELLTTFLCVAVFFLAVFGCAAVIEVGVRLRRLYVESYRIPREVVPKILQDAAADLELPVPVWWWWEDRNTIQLEYRKKPVGEFMLPRLFGYKIKYWWPPERRDVE